MNRTFTSFLTGAAMVVAAGSAQAITISGGTASNAPGQFTDYSNALSNPSNVGGILSKFDTTIGTLNSVTFTVAYGFNSVLTITAGGTGAAGSAQTESGAAFHSTDTAINAVLNALVNVVPGGVAFGPAANQQLNPAAYDITGNKAFFSLTPFASTTGASNGSGNNTYSTTSASYLSAFGASGGGTFDALGQTLTGTIVSLSSGNATATQTTTATQSISITYDYTAAPPPPPTGVPEPASIALLGAGLLGLGLVRRKA